jgi:hypothetical protein
VNGTVLAEIAKGLTGAVIVVRNDQNDSEPDPKRLLSGREAVRSGNLSTTQTRKSPRAGKRDNLMGWKRPEDYLMRWA